MRNEGDDGFTLMDTLMATVVMTVVMAVFTTSIVAMYRSARSVEEKSDAQTQLSTALQRLDREVRYAVGISRPYDGGRSVDFLTLERSTKLCVQVRLAGGVLTRRTWTYQQAPGSGWSTLATGVGEVAGTAPFVYSEPTPTLGYQQLTVTLAAGVVPYREVNTVSFTALNSGRTTGNDYCGAGRT